MFRRLIALAVSLAGFSPLPANTPFNDDDYDPDPRTLECLAFTANGRYALSASNDRAVRRLYLPRTQP